MNLPDSTINTLSKPSWSRCYWIKQIWAWDKIFDATIIKCVWIRKLVLDTQNPFVEFVQAFAGFFDDYQTPDNYLKISSIDFGGFELERWRPYPSPKETLCPFIRRFISGWWGGWGGGKPIGCPGPLSSNSPRFLWLGGGFQWCFCWVLIEG